MMSDGSSSITFMNRVNTLGQRKRRNTVDISMRVSSLAFPSLLPARLVLTLDYDGDGIASNGVRPSRLVAISAWGRGCRERHVAVSVRCLTVE